MKFVNISRRHVYNAVAGNLAPGAVSSEKGKGYGILEEAMSKVVNACGSNLGIRLNEREAALLSKLMDLDQKGSGFSQKSIPEAIRKDPTGAARALERSREAQREEQRKVDETNTLSIRREAEINGETLERNPVGPATMKGEKVEASDLKSGFEKILEENARIASGESKPKMDAKEALDPIGAHMKGTEAPKATDEQGSGEDANAPIPKPASGVEGDVARTADANEPVPQAQDSRSNADKNAAELAKGLSVFSVLNNPPKKAKDKADKADKAGKPAKDAKAAKSGKKTK